MYKLTYEWCLRSCFTATITCFFCLYTPSQKFITADGDHAPGLAFVSFIAIAVKDSTLGSTIMNGWSSLIGVGFAVLCCWLYLIFVTSDIYSPTRFPLLFLLSFFVQYVEFPVLGKKLSLCILSLSFLARDCPAAFYELYFVCDIIYGTFFALLGNLLPWPKFASSFVEDCQSYISEVNVLIHNLLSSIEVLVFRYYRAY